MKTIKIDGEFKEIVIVSNKINNESVFGALTKETEKAVLIKLIDMNGVSDKFVDLWLPKSQILRIDDSLHIKIYYVSDWIWKQKDLIGERLEAVFDILKNYTTYKLGESDIDRELYKIFNDDDSGFTRL